MDHTWAYSVIMDNISHLSSLCSFAKHFDGIAPCATSQHAGSHVRGKHDCCPYFREEVGLAQSGYRLAQGCTVT